MIVLISIFCSWSSLYEEIEHYGIDWNGPVSTDQGHIVEVPEYLCPLNDYNLALLQQSVDFHIDDEISELISIMILWLKLHDYLKFRDLAHCKMYCINIQKNNWTEISEIRLIPQSSNSTYQFPLTNIFNNQYPLIISYGNSNSNSNFALTLNIMI